MWNSWPYRSTWVHSRVSSGVRVTGSLNLCVMFCISLFVLLTFFCWPLCCLSFDLLHIITTLVSWNPFFSQIWQYIWLSIFLYKIIWLLTKLKTSDINLHLMLRNFEKKYKESIFVQKVTLSNLITSQVTVIFSGLRVAQSWVFCVVLCR